MQNCKTNEKLQKKHQNDAGEAWDPFKKIERNSLIISSNVHANPLAGARAVAVLSQKKRPKEFLAECAIVSLEIIVWFYSFIYSFFIVFL